MIAIASTWCFSIFLHNFKNYVWQVSYLGSVCIIRTRNPLESDFLLRLPALDEIFTSIGKLGLQLFCFRRRRSLQPWALIYGRFFPK